MNRRDSIAALLALGATAAPLRLFAETQTVRRPYRIALLPDFSPAWAPRFLKFITEELRKSGRIEGRDYVFYRSGVYYGPKTKLALERVLAAEPDLILVFNVGYAIAAHKRTRTIPIVMWVSGYPVESGVAESLARPGKNVTGLTIYVGGEVYGKLVSLVHEAKPSAKRIGAILSYGPPFHTRAEADLIIQGMRDAAESLGVDLRIFEFAKSEQIDDALAWVIAQRVEALVLTSDPSIEPHKQKIMQFAVANRLPTITDTGWGPDEPQPLLSYGVLYARLLRQAATYVNRILWEGAKPGDLPIQLPTKFKFWVNLKTANAIGLVVPPSIMVRADRVIE